MIWASRLGIYLFTRVRNVGKDVRFEKAKRHFFWFLQYWMGQALWVSLTACAAIIAILSPEDNTLPVFAIVGMALWLSGFTIDVHRIFPYNMPLPPIPMWGALFCIFLYTDTVDWVFIQLGSSASCGRAHTSQGS